MLINKINPKNVRRTKNYDKRRNQESLQNHHFILCVRKRDSRLVILEDLIFTEQEINSLFWSSPTGHIPKGILILNG
jgi:hypothetical protein